MMTDRDLNIDQQRLAYLARILDGIGETNFHKTAADLAETFQRETVGELDYYRAVCVAIDTVRMRERRSTEQRSKEP